VAVTTPAMAASARAFRPSWVMDWAMAFRICQVNIAVRSDVWASTKASAFAAGLSAAD
jgi:hypothetical protein